jgi:hypothetical protein
MIERIKRLLLQPKVEWPAIDAEPMTVKSIFMGWVLPLAAIGPVCSLIGGQVFGIGAFGFSYRPPIVGAVVTAVLGYALSIVGVFVLSLVIDALAPSFNGQKNPVQATKVAAFAATASYLGGVFGIIPMLAILGLLAALYSLYLFWIGLPLLMKVPADKAVGYVVVTIIAAIVVNFVVGLLVGLIAAPLMMASTMASASTGGGSFTVPGVGTIDTAKMEAATQKLQATAQQMQTANQGGATVPAVSPDALQSMLPTSVAGFTRTTVSSQGGSAAGIGGSNAEGEYTLADKSFKLSVTDANAMGALATLGGALNVQSSKTTATGYEKTQMVGGRMVSEEWDNSDSHGKFTTMVGSRFIVAAEGSAPNIDTLKQAVATIDMGRLEAMSK